MSRRLAEDLRWAEREVIKAIWLSAEQPCGKRLKAALPLWLPFYEKRHGQLESKVKAKVLAASAATIDRLLAPCRISLGSRGRCGTRPGTLLRSQIPIRTEHWEVSGPGFIEADTVAHCGAKHGGGILLEHYRHRCAHPMDRDARGAQSGQAAVAQRIAQIEAALPFPILGFDTDNGGEFLNWHLVDYFGKRRVPVRFTRSRAYRKNDNARVEQKNWTHVRQLVGYGRLEGEQVAELLDELYRKEWSLFRNFFCPVMKHLRTESKGSCKRRIYDQPATPLARLKACPQANPVQIARLEQLMVGLDPFALKEKIEQKLRAILRQQVRPSLHQAA